jgi:mannose-6-phosphate isomerase-like protein (cupin superfamily)
MAAAFRHDADTGGMSTITAGTEARRIADPLRGDRATFLETSAESGGERTLIEIELAPGDANRPHRHVAFAERFTVLEGTLTVRVGDRELHLQPGETAAAPICALHAFSNRTGAPVRFHIEILPGHRGFEQALQIAYGLAQDGLVRPDGVPRRLTHLALLLDMGGTRLAGPRSLLQPLFGLAARRGRRKGLERELVARSCRF